MWQLNALSVTAPDAGRHSSSVVVVSTDACTSGVCGFLFLLDLKYTGKVQKNYVFIVFSVVLHMWRYAHVEICIGSQTVGVCGERGTISVSALSQLHTERRYNYPNNHSIHTARTWFTSPPATGLTTRGNLTGIQPVHSTAFTKEEETQSLVSISLNSHIKNACSHRSCLFFPRNTLS